MNNIDSDYKIVDEEFNKYLKDVSSRLYEDIKDIKLEKKDFLLTILNEKNNICQKLNDLKQSNAPNHFINFIIDYLDYGTQSPFWYYEAKNHTSIIHSAPEVYNETSQKYIIAREWLNKLKKDNMI